MATGVAFYGQERLECEHDGLDGGGLVYRCLSYNFQCVRLRFSFFFFFTGFAISEVGRGMTEEESGSFPFLSFQIACVCACMI